MVAEAETHDARLVYHIRLTSVGPKSVTGDHIYEPSNMDLAMKLHYIRLVYFFRVEEVGGIRPMMLKESIFNWLDYYFETCGRFRRSETTGRPYIKCNDCGARFVEAKSDKTVDEWVGMKDISSQRLLVPDQVLGPDLGFSPTILMQMTFLKCGGISIGLSWAHVLGDAFSLADYMNTWARHMSHLRPDHPPNLSKCQPKIDDFPINPHALGSGPLATKRVGPVGDHWVRGPPTPKIGTYSIHLSPNKLAQLQEEIFGLKGTQRLPPFETISAVIWQAIAKSKDGEQQQKPNTVITIIKKDRPHHQDLIHRHGAPSIPDRLSNDQLVSTVRVDFSIAEAQTKDLAALIHDQAVDERAQIAELTGKEAGMGDFLIYGANLTLVNWEEVPLYGFGLMGAAPSLVSCFVDGIGDEGVVLVLPAPPMEGSEEDGCSGDGRVVTLILPEERMSKLKNQLKQEWSIE